MQTDNSCLDQKVKLRLQFLPTAPEINILDCYHGQGVLWREIQKRTLQKINVLGIDKKKESTALLIGDNMKFLRGLPDLNKYDVIDLDAYGIPFDQIIELFRREYKGDIFITYIQSVIGNLPKKMLLYLGYTESMLKKAQTLFTRNGFEKLKRILSRNGVKQIDYYFKNNKVYCHYRVEK